MPVRMFRIENRLSSGSLILRGAETLLNLLPITSLLPLWASLRDPPSVSPVESA